MKTVHFYGRFSTMKQSDGDSQRRQETGYEKFLKSGKYRPGLQFLDRGKSAHRGHKQKALGELLKAVGDKRIAPGDIVFCEHIDRLSRKGIRPTQELICRIFNAGVDIAIHMPLNKTYFAKDINDFSGTVELAAFAYAAYIYSDALSKRVRNWGDYARSEMQKGRKFPANSPGWVRWNKAKKNYELINEEAAKTIRHIFKRTIDGLGVPSVLAELQADFKPLGRKVWNETYVRNILNGRQVLGEHQPGSLDENGKLVPDGKPVPDYFPKIIDEKIWLAAQAAIANRRKETGPSGDWVSLFTGIVHHALDDCPAHVYSYQQTRADGRKVTIRRLKSYKADKREKGASTETVCMIQFECAILSFMKEINVNELNSHVSGQTKFNLTKGELVRKERRVAEIEAALKGESEEGESESVASLMRVLKDLNKDIAKLKLRLQAESAEALQSPALAAENVKVLMYLPQTNENRQLLREAIKRVVRRISIAPMKLEGKNRRDPVLTIVELEFFAGHRRMLILCNGEGIVIDHKEPKRPPMSELPDVRKWASDLLPGLRQIFASEIGGVVHADDKKAAMEARLADMRKESDLIESMLAKAKRLGIFEKYPELAK